MTDKENSIAAAIRQATRYCRVFAVWAYEGRYEVGQWDENRKGYLLGKAIPSKTLPARATWQDTLT